MKLHPSVKKIKLLCYFAGAGVAEWRLLLGIILGVLLRGIILDNWDLSQAFKEG